MLRVHPREIYSCVYGNFDVFIRLDNFVSDADDDSCVSAYAQDVLSRISREETTRRIVFKRMNYVTQAAASIAADYIAIDRASPWIAKTPPANNARRFPREIERHRQNVHYIKGVISRRCAVGYGIDRVNTRNLIA